MLHTPASLSGIIDRVLEAAQDEVITVQALVQSVGRAGFTPLLLVPALAVATPLSGIPMFSAFMGMLIFLVSFQLLLRRRHLWLPGWILNRQVSGARVRSAFEKLRPPMIWLEHRTTPRFRIFSDWPVIMVPQILCLLSGLMMPLLEFVPFSSSVVGLGVVLLALGMLTRDGILALVALVPYAGAGWLVASVI
jgi:hypothetical protein